MQICNIKQLTYFLKHFRNDKLIVYTDDFGIEIKDETNKIIGSIDSRNIEIDIELLRKINNNGGTECPLKQGG